MLLENLILLVIAVYYCNGQGSTVPGTLFYETNINEPLSMIEFNTALLPFRCDTKSCPATTTRCLFVKEPLPSGQKNAFKILMQCLNGDLTTDFVSVEAYETLVPVPDPNNPLTTPCFGPQSRRNTIQDNTDNILENKAFDTPIMKKSVNYPLKSYKELPQSSNLEENVFDTSTNEEIANPAVKSEGMPPEKVVSVSMPMKKKPDIYVPTFEEFYYWPIEAHKEKQRPLLIAF